MKVPAFFTKPDESTRIFVPVATLSYFPVFIFYCLLLFFKRKYLKQGKEIQQNCTGPEKFGICFCVIFNHNDQSFGKRYQVLGCVSSQLETF